MPASNIKTAMDYGDAITAYGGTVAYKKKSNQPQLGIVNYSLRVGDDVNVAPYTFPRDDRNVSNGTTHRTWSAIEMAVTMLPGNSGSQTIPQNGSHTVWDPASTFFTAPVSGRLRFRVGWWTTAHYHIWLNQIYLYQATGDDLQTHYCAIVSPGDIVGIAVEGSVNTVSWIFLPEVYTT